MIAPLLLAAALQTAHPCDIPPPVDRTASPFRAGVCWNQTGLDGQPTEPATELRVFVDGALAATLFNPQPIGPPNAVGEFYYEVSDVVAPRGDRVLTFTVVNEVGESLPSDPFSFRVLGARPGKPTKARVEKAQP